MHGHHLLPGLHRPGGRRRQLGGERPDLHRQDRRRRGGYRRSGGPLPGPAHPGGVLLLLRREDAGRGGGVGQRGCPTSPAWTAPRGTRCPTDHSTVTVPLDEFKSKLLAQYPQADLSGEPAAGCATLSPNSAGGVETVDIGGVTVGGGSLRTLFGLRSTSSRSPPRRMVSPSPSPATATAWA